MRADILTFFLIYGRSIQSFPMSMVLAMEFFFIPLSGWRHFSIISSLLKVFCHEMLLEFVKWFFCIYWDGHVVFLLLVQCIDFHVKPIFHSWDKSHLVTVCNAFYMWLISVCYLFGENFASGRDHFPFSRCFCLVLLSR